MTDKDKARPMNREMIEDKDLFLLKKIREILRHKELLKYEEEIPEKKTVWQRPGFWLLILCAGGIMTGLMFFRKPCPIIPSTDPGVETEAAVEEIPSTVGTKNADPVEVVDIREMAPAPEPRPKAMASFVEMAPVREFRQEEIVPSMETDPPEKEAVPQQEDGRACEDVSTPVVPVKSMAEAPAIPAEKTGVFSGSSGIRISEIVSCREIAQREYNDARKAFSLEKDAAASVWMNVVSDEPPFTLTHVYYLNGSRYCEVPLEIRYKSMRTWSNITLRGRAHIGDWRVEVVTGNGEILDRIEFTVAP